MEVTIKDGSTLKTGAEPYDFATDVKAEPIPGVGVASAPAPQSQEETYFSSIPNRDDPRPVPVIVEMLPTKDLAGESPAPSGIDAATIPNRHGKLNSVYDEVFRDPKSNPDRDAQVLELAKKMDEDPAYVAENFDAIKSAEERPSKSFIDDVENTFPGTAKFLQTPEYALAHRKSIPQLTYIEKQLGYIKNQFSAGQNTVELSQLGEKDFLGLAGPEDLKRIEKLQGEQVGLAQRGGEFEKDFGFFSEIPGAVSNQIPILGSTLKGGAEGVVGGAVLGGVLGIPGGPVGIVGGVTSGGFTGYKIMSALSAARMEGGLAYVEFKNLKDNRGHAIDPTVARGAAVVVGAVNGALELVGFEAIAKAFPGVSALKRQGMKKIINNPTMRGLLLDIGKKVAHAAGTEGLTESLQEAVTALGGKLAQYANSGEAGPLTANKVVEILGDGFKFAAGPMLEAGIKGAQGGGGLSVVGQTGRAAIDVTKIKRAEKTVETLNNVAKGIETTESLKDSPKHVREFVETQVKGGTAEDVYVPRKAWDEYWSKQKDGDGNPVDPGAAFEEVTGNREAYDQSTDSQEDLRIPFASYASTILMGPHHKVLNKEVRMGGPNEMTGREAEEEVKKADKKAEETPDEYADLRKEIADAHAPLDFDEQTKREMVDVAVNKTVKRARLLGVDPLEHYRKNPIQFAAGVNSGNVLFQAGLPAVQPTVSPIGLYSQVEKEVLGMNFEAMPAGQLLNTIKNIQGLKQEELKQLGLEEWLSSLADQAGKLWLVLDTKDKDSALLSAFPAAFLTEAEAQTYAATDPARFTIKKADGRVSKADVLNFIKSRSLDMSQTVYGEMKPQPESHLLPPSRGEGEVPVVSELSWDDGVAQEPDDSYIESEADYYINDYAGEGSKDNEHGYFGESWGEFGEEHFREEILDNKDYVLSYEKDEDGDPTEDVELVWDNGWPVDAKGVNFGKGKAGEKRKKNFVKAMEEALTKEFQSQAEEAARERYWEDSDYQEHVYTEFETDWTLSGRPGDTDWYSPEMEKSYSGSIETAQEKLLEDMLAKGVVESDEDRQARREAEGEQGPRKMYTLPIGPPLPKSPNEPTLNAKHTNYIKNKGKNAREFVFKSNSVNAFSGGHYSQQGQIASVIVSDHVTTDGKRVLNIHESQSDRFAEIRKLRAELSDAEERASSGQDTGAAREVERIKNRISDIEAPFENPEAWLALVMKNMLRVAAQEGYDAVVWDPASIVTERWSGGGPEAITWVKKPAGYRVESSDPRIGIQRNFFNSEEEAKAAIENDIQEISRSHPEISADEVRRALTVTKSEGGFLVGKIGDAVTKDTEKLKEHASALDPQRNAEIVHSADDLRYGGKKLWEKMQKADYGVYAKKREGYEFEYDNLLPKKVVPAILKKLDKSAKVSIAEIKANSYAEPHKVWSVDITPQMREKILNEGQTLFQEDIKENPQTVPWEAIPQAELGHEINKASFKVQRQFTRDAAAIVADLAAKLGMTPDQTEGVGGFEGAITPNYVTGFKNATPEQMAAFSQAIQYIFRQKGVGYFKAIFGADVEKQGDVLTFSEPVTKGKLQQLHAVLSKHIKNVGFTLFNDKQVFVVDFMGEKEAYEAAFAELENERENLGITGTEFFGTDGNYFEHDWTVDPEGKALAETVAKGSPDLQSWLDDRRADFDALLDRYSGDELAEKESADEKLTTGNKQISKPAPRGAFDRIRKVIEMGEKADLFTWLHESGHQWLDEMAEDYAHIKALPAHTTEQAEFIKDCETLLSWLGVSSFAEIDTQKHEKFAKGLELFFAEGKAPSPELESVFERFAAWFSEIYQSFAAQYFQGVELNDDVRAVFGRMITAQSKVEAAEAELNTDIFRDESDRQNAIAAKAEARAEMVAKIKKDVERKKKKSYQDIRAQVKEKITADVDSQPVYQALAFLGRGKKPDGSPLEEGDKPLKLSKKALEKMFPKGILDKLPRPYVWSAKDGVHPDDIATRFGFRSGSEMVIQMAAAEQRDALIERLTEEQMNRQMPDMTDEQLSEEAVNAVHNEKRAHLLRRQLEILAEKSFATVKQGVRNVAKKLPVIHEIRKQAEQTIAGKSVRDIKPETYRRAEIRAAKEAMDHYLRGDFDAAFDAKQNELLNSELYRAALSAQEEVGRIVDYAKSFQSGAKVEVLKKAGSNLRDIIDGILESYDFRSGVSLKDIDQRKSLLNWIESNKENGINVPIPDSVLYNAGLKHYKDVRLEELRDVDTSLKLLYHQAKLKTQLLANKRQREFIAAQEEIVAEIESRHKVDRGPKDVTPGFKDRLVRGPETYAAWHTRMEFLFEDLGGKAGAVWQLLFKPFADAEAEEALMRTKAIVRMKQIFDKYDRWERAGWHVEKQYIEGTKTEKHTGNFTKGNILAIALNWGNEYNRQSLMEGYGWSETQVEKILDQLTEKDWQTVKEVWELINDFWPQIVELETAVHGVAPEKVLASPFKTKFGMMPGGYYPLQFDSNISERQYKLDEASTVDEMFGKTTRAATRQGHTKERTDSGGKPVKLELSVIVDHVSNVIHDLSHRRAVIDVSRLVNSKPVQDAIIGAAGKEMYRQLNPWLKSIAGDRPITTSPLDSILSRARTNATTVALGLKVTSGIMQILGTFNSLHKLGPEYAIRGFTAALARPWNLDKTMQFITERSSVMRERIESWDRDIKSALKTHMVTGVPHGGTKVGAYLSPLQTQARESFFYLTGFMDKLTSVPAWLGAYRKAMDGRVENIEMGDEKAAIDYADSVVRTTQSAGSVKDLSAIERTPHLKIWTMFYSQLAVQYNLMQSATKDFVRTKNAPQMLAAIACLWLLPVAAEKVLRGQLPDADDDDDDEKKADWWKQFGTQLLFYPGHSVVGVRDVLQAWERYVGAGRADFSNPIFEAAESTIYGLGAGYKMATEDQEATRKQVKGLAMAVGYLFGLPARQVWLTSEYLHDWLISGEEAPSNIAEGAYRSLVTGKEKKR